MAHAHKKLKSKVQSVQKIEWKQMDGQTDVADCFTFSANAVVGNHIVTTTHTINFLRQLCCRLMYTTQLKANARN